MDLTFGYQQALEAAEAKAKAYLDVDNSLGAAGEYARCAHLLRQLAQSARSSTLKEQRLVRAQRFEDLSNRFKNGGLPVPSSRRAGPAEESGETTDDLVDRVRGLITKAGVSWQDIAGLDEVKSQIRSLFAIALAQKPEGMSVDERPNVLLYGPPGTGKTLLAAAASKGFDATFYSVTAGDLLSKYFGESPQLMAKLFEEANRTAPSVVFLDEVEALSPDRDAPGGVSGPEARLLSQFLSELDGLGTKSADSLVITIAATNKPWLLDDAALSRFARLVYVGLPDKPARTEMFRLGIERAGFATETAYSDLAEMTQGLSGREISAGCREAIRAMLGRANPTLESTVDEGAEAVRAYQLKALPVTSAEILGALSGVRSATSAEDLAAYESWREGK